MKLKQMVAALVETYMARTGLTLYALAPVVDKIDAVPESQRGWYAPGTEANAGKFVLDLTKVEVEDVGGLKTALATERENNRKAKATADKAVADALKAYEGIDPVKTREMLAKLGSEEEAALIAAGKLDEVVAKRTEKLRKEYDKKLEEATGGRDGALEVASTFMDRVLENHIRAAASKAGLHASAVDDAIFRAHTMFSIDDDGNPVQFEEDGETVVLGKDGKTPFSPEEWLESMKETAPHWFPAGASGGGAGGNKSGAGSGKTIKRSAFEAMDPVERAATMKEKVQVID